MDIAHINEACSWYFFCEARNCSNDRIGFRVANEAIFAQATCKIEPRMSKGTPPMKKKCFLSGIARMRGGGGPCLNQKIHYIYLFLTAEKDVQVARNGGRGRGGEVIRAMSERGVP